MVYIGTIESDIRRVKIDSEHVKSIEYPETIIDETGTGSHIYYGEVDTTLYSVVGFELIGSSNSGTVIFTIWSTDDINATLADDNDWVNITRIVMNGLASLSGADVEDIFPVTTHLTSRKFRVKCQIISGTTHSINVNALLI